MLWLGVLLSAFFLWLALRKIDWPAFWLALRNARLIYLPLLFAWGSLTYLLRSTRWRILLTPEKKIPLAEVHWANMAGYLGNFVLPARIGELVRSLYLSKSASMSASFILATALVERLLDVVALLAIGAVSLIALGVLPLARLTGGSLSAPTGLLMMAAVVVLGIGLIVVLPRLQDLFARIIQSLPWPGPTVKARLIGLMEQFLLGLHSLSSLHQALAFALLTLLIWGMDGLSMVFLARAFGLEMALSQALVLLAGLGLASTIPSTPGSLGIYQYVALLILEPMGYTPEASLAYILVAQGLGYLVVISWGGLAAWRFARRFN